MTKRVVAKPGDVISVPLANDVFASFVVTYVFKKFKNCIAIGVLPELTIHAVAPSNVHGEFCVYPLFVGKQLITAGLWPRVGHITLFPRYEAAPEMIVAGYVYRGDTPLRTASSVEMKALPELLAHGGLALQNRLRSHFGIAANESSV